MAATEQAGLQPVSTPRRAFEIPHSAMTTVSGPGTDVLGPLAAHALMIDIDPIAAAEVVSLLSRVSGPVAFGEVVDTLGSRVAARFAVLALLGSGAVVVATPGYLTDASLVALCLN